MLPPAQVLPFAATSADVTLYTGAAVLLGWALVETTGTASAALDIRDGTGTAGQSVVPVTLAANESTRDYPPGNGIAIQFGLFIDMTSGSARGTLWYLPVTSEDDLAFVHGQLRNYWVKPGV